MSRLRIAIALLATFVCAGAAAAQPGIVRGHVYAAPERTPVAYALVRLAPAGGGAGRTAITDEHGAFAFGDVAPESYRLRLERIGFATEQTGVFAVAAGETVERTLGSQPRAVALAPIVASPVCRTGAELGQDSALAALWSEALKSIETRIAFDATYHYEYDAEQTLTATRQHGGRPQSLRKHIVSDPREPIDHNRSGWGWFTRTHIKLEVPDGREILDPRFLASHCLDGGLDEATGEYTLGFHPQRTRRGRVDIRGELRLERAMLQVSAIEVEWIDAERVLMSATVEFRDAYVPGGVVRMPVGAIFTGTTPPSMGMGDVRGEVRYVNHGQLRKIEM